MTSLNILGAALAITGLIWLVIVAFRRGVLWGIFNLLVQPVAGLIFVLFKKEGLTPFLLMIAGLVLSILNGGMTVIGYHP